MHRPARLLTLCCTVAAVLASPLRAQAGGDARGDQAPPVLRTSVVADSPAVLRGARRAQAAFERARRWHLPRKYSARPRQCAEIIGRFCYWDDDSTDDVLVRTPPPPEPPKIVAARAGLLAQLDSAAKRLPGDEWIAGMHVHYLLEAGRIDDAARRADACRAASWWCHALAGLVAHTAQRYASADSLYSLSIAAMPDGVRCEWMSVEVLVDDEIREEYRSLPCAKRAALDDRLWWLADPLHLQPGNDRRTEHYARATRARIHRGSASSYGVRWADDLDVIVRRFGWPSHYTQSMPPAASNAPPSVSVFHDDPGYRFLPDSTFGADLGVITDSSWRLRPERPRERYAPPYATFATLAQQTTLFRRGDSTLAVVAYDASADSILGPGPITAGLIATRGPNDASPSRTVVQGGPARGTLALVLPDTVVLASVELLARARVRRARFGLGFANVESNSARISQLGLFEPTDTLPGDVESFRAMARASARLIMNSRVGLFWEMYGIRSTSDEVTLDVEVVRDGGGWLRRAGERVGLVGPPARSRVGWRESPDGRTISARSFVLDLTGLDPGGYRITVTITPPGEETVVARRRIEIVRRGTGPGD